jgi:hypothetical protein
VIFARSSRESADPDIAFGSNIVGTVVGGPCESFSTLLGFRYMLLLAIFLCRLSIGFRLPRERAAKSPALC